MVDFRAKMAGFGAKMADFGVKMEVNDVAVLRQTETFTFGPVGSMEGQGMTTQDYKVKRVGEYTYSNRLLSS